MVCRNTNGVSVPRLLFSWLPEMPPDPEKINAVNKKTMGELLENTRRNTAYLRRYVKMVEMWECE